MTDHKIQKVNGSDGRPTEPGWYHYRLPDGTWLPVEVYASLGALSFRAYTLSLPYNYRRAVKGAKGTWGPRIPEWEPEEGGDANDTE
jgi:hypothetical protein